MKKLRILLADDHIVMRTGLRALLEHQPNLEVVGETENGREIHSLSLRFRADPIARRLETTPSLPTAIAGNCSSPSTRNTQTTIG